MNTGDCIRSARRNLMEAGSYLDSGHGINWVADTLSTALLWAMEAWLLVHGHPYNHGGFFAMRMEFVKNAPPELVSRVTACLAKTSFLEHSLMGDIDGLMPVLPIESWKIEAYTCLEEAEKVIDEMLAAIPDQQYGP